FRQSSRASTGRPASVKVLALAARAAPSPGLFPDDLAMTMAFVEYASEFPICPSSSQCFDNSTSFPTVDGVLELVCAAKDISAEITITAIIHARDVVGNLICSLLGVITSTKCIYESTRRAQACEETRHTHCTPFKRVAIWSFSHVE